MTSSRDREARSEGSALVLALLVAFILSLLGISFLLIAETESQIAQNERRAAQALRAAEAGARLVKRWFDRPGTFANFPSPAVVERTQRIVVDESDPNVLSQPANGASIPYYKQGVDLDGDGVEDLFRAPYRGDLLHKLMGTEDGPDMRIDDQDSGQAAFLDQVSASLLGGLAEQAGGVRLRISRIDLYAPPYIETSGGWTRFGVGTVKVVARLYRGQQALAQRTVRAVLNEAPYAGPYGALHSCAELTFTGNPITVHWGAITAEADTKLSPDPENEFPESLPRRIPVRPWIDELYPADPAPFDAFKLSVDLQVIPDPWLRMVGGGPIAGLPTASSQPWPPEDPPPDCRDDSHLVQKLPPVTCPGYDYDVWKAIATSGGSDVHYYVPSGTLFSENGIGTPRTFRDITDQQTGFFFFDTQDGRAPTDLDQDGVFDNLTEPIDFSGSWVARGFIYLNAERFEAAGVTGVDTTLNAPGEPFLDADLDGQWDPGERYLNLSRAPQESNILIDAADTPARNPRGPDLTRSVSFQGILYTSGTFEATGPATYYGSVIARTGVVQEIEDGTAPTPTLYWDESIRTGWPPPGWELPRLIVTRWETGP